MSSKLNIPNSFSIAGSNSKYKISNHQPAGFWSGLWHGIIAPLTFLASLFDSRVSVYETNNNGHWYEFSFLLGMGVLTRGYRR